MRGDLGLFQCERFLACHIELIDIYRSNLDARGQRATWHSVPIRSIGTPASRATLAYSARQPRWPWLAYRHAGTNSHTGHRGTIGTLAIVPGWHRGAIVAAVSKLGLIYGYIDASISSEVLQWPKKMSGRLSQAAKRRSCWA
jgi:hypothetical protein